MIGMTAAYLGELTCEATHVRSGNVIRTDAPVDNNGKGEAFSPTDLLATSLAMCMMTVMGIAAREKGIPLGKMNASIEKIMGTNPRRVAGIHIVLELEEKGWDEKQWAILVHTAQTCPVAKSLHPDLHQNIELKRVGGDRQC